MDGQVNTIDLAAKVDREPRMHISADLSSEKFSLHLTQWRVELYGLPCFSEIRDANLLLLVDDGCGWDTLYTLIDFRST